MGLIKEPLDVDFVVDSRPLTPKEELAISEFIKTDKAKRASSGGKNSKSRSSRKTKATV